MRISYWSSDVCSSDLPPVEVAQIKCCGAFICRMSRHWKIVRFWNSDSVGWKLWPQTALSNSAAAKGVPQAATEHARLSKLSRVETKRVVSARNIGDVMLVENVSAVNSEIQREVENAGTVQIEI